MPARAKRAAAAGAAGAAVASRKAKAGYSKYVAPRVEKHNIAMGEKKAKAKRFKSNLQKEREMLQRKEKAYNKRNTRHKAEGMRDARKAARTRLFNDTTNPAYRPKKVKRTVRPNHGITNRLDRRRS